MQIDDRFSVGERIALNRMDGDWCCRRCGWADALAKFVTWLQDRAGLTIKHCKCESCNHRFRVIEVND